MEAAITTTPFGRRTVSLDQIAADARLRGLVEEAGKPGSNHPAAVNKWRLFRVLAEIRERLGVSDRSLGVLNALLSFQQETALTLPKPRETEEGGTGASPACDLVVFPSNKALSLRAHGMAEKTLRRHLAALVEAGLIARRDSPNGKRYARRDESGQERYSDAFGFDLTPLVARAPEFEAIAEEERRVARARALQRERISLLRRDAGKLITCGLDEGLQGNFEAYRQRFMALLSPLRRLKGDADFDRMEADLAALRREVTNALETHVKFNDMTGNDAEFDRQEPNSNYTIASDLEPAFNKPESLVLPDPGSAVSESEAIETNNLADLQLGLVLEACPDIVDFHGGGGIPRSWPEFVGAARLLRPMLGVSPDAWREAVEALGEKPAAAALAAILQRSEHSSEAETHRDAQSGSLSTTVNGSPAIRSAGGYLRALTEKARAGEFALGPVLMALIGQRLKRQRGVAT